ncbi:MAG: proton-conducting transporter membrane subunit, partial [Acidimicrobiales bacterium]
AGSVIHAMNDEQDTKVMGGLARVMPITGITFLIAWFSIGGLPPFSGFWSKGDVLQNAYAFSPVLYAVGAFTAILTAYYLGRCYLLVFSGKARWVEARRDHGGGLHPLEPHDPGWAMTVPLVVLAVASVLGGFIDLPFLTFLESWLRPVVGSRLFDTHFGTGTQVLFAVVDMLLALVGIGLAVVLWRTTAERREAEPAFLQRAWYIDFAYDRVLARSSTAWAAFTSAVVERKVIDGAVNGFAALCRNGGRVIRRTQTGYVRNYALGLSAGLVLLLAYVLSRVVA